VIISFLYKCRRCGQAYHRVLPEGTEPLLAQISIHECGDTTADGHLVRGMSEMIGFNETNEEDA
jgi:hypothetical protein